MTRHTWTLAAVAGLYLSLVPACIHQGAANVANPAPELVGTADGLYGGESPYQPIKPTPPGRPPQTGAAGPDVDVGAARVDPPPTHLPDVAPGAGTAPQVNAPAPTAGGPDRQVQQAQFPAEPTGLERNTVPPQGAGSPPEGPQVLVVPPLKVSKASAEQAPPPLPPVVEALNCLLQDQPREALASMKRYNGPNRELLLGLLALAARLCDSGGLERADPHDLAAVVHHLDRMEESLQPHAALVIDKLCICRKIRSFGDYEPYRPNHRFHPGERDFRLYAEVRNFTSVQSQVGEQTFYKICLEISAQILDEQGKQVWPPQGGWRTFERHDDEPSRTQRHDYFDNCWFTVPELPPGDYKLWIMVKDQPTGRTAKRPVDLHVTAGLSMQPS
jgi:hypothetical protein